MGQLAVGTGKWEWEVGDQCKVGDLEVDDGWHACAMQGMPLLWGHALH